MNKFECICEGQDWWVYNGYHKEIQHNTYLDLSEFPFQIKSLWQSNEPLGLALMAVNCMETAPADDYGITIVIQMTPRATSSSILSSSALETEEKTKMERTPAFCTDESMRCYIYTLLHSGIMLWFICLQRCMRTMWTPVYGIWFYWIIF